MGTPIPEFSDEWKATKSFLYASITSSSVMFLACCTAIQELRDLGEYSSFFSVFSFAIPLFFFSFGCCAYLLWKLGSTGLRLGSVSVLLAVSIISHMAVWVRIAVIIQADPRNRTEVLWIIICTFAIISSILQAIILVMIQRKNDYKEAPDISIISETDTPRGPPEHPSHKLLSTAAPVRYYSFGGGSSSPIEVQRSSSFTDGYGYGSDAAGVVANALSMSRSVPIAMGRSQFEEGNIFVPPEMIATNFPAMHNHYKHHHDSDESGSEDEPAQSF